MIKNITTHNNGRLHITYMDGSCRGTSTDDDEIQAWIAEGNTPEIYVAPEPTYAELRQAEYPSFAKQLDMQYWDDINGTTNWADTIAAIKIKYPKPETAS